MSFVDKEASRYDNGRLLRDNGRLLRDKARLLRNKAWLFGKKGLAKDLASIIDIELCLTLGGLVEESEYVNGRQSQSQSLSSKNSIPFTPESSLLSDITY